MAGWILGLDSGRFEKPEKVEEVLLAPGNRADLLVTAREGSTTLRAVPYDRGDDGMMGGMMGGGRGSSSAEVTLATVTVADADGGSKADALPALPRQATPRDLRGAAVTARREFTFEMGMGAMPSMTAGERARTAPKTLHMGHLPTALGAR